MTTARLTKRRNKLEKNAAEAAALIASGSESQAEVARMFGCSREAVSAFCQRHADDIEAIRAEVERQVTDYSIAHKVERIGAYDSDWRALGRELSQVMDQESGEDI